MLLGHARRIVDGIRAAAADIRALSAAGPVRIAVEPGATSLLPSAVRRIAGIDKAGLAISELPADVQAELVASGTVDFGLGSFMCLPTSVTSRVLAVDRWVLVIRPGSSLPVSDSLQSLFELRGTRMIVPLDVDLLDDEVIACDRITTALDLVRSGVGCGLLPALVAERDNANLRVIELGNLSPRRVVSMIWHARRRLPGIRDALEEMPDAEPEHRSEALPLAA